MFQFDEVIMINIAFNNPVASWRDISYTDAQMYFEDYVRMQFYEQRLYYYMLFVVWKLDFAVDQNIDSRLEDEFVLYDSHLLCTKIWSRI